MWLQCLVRSHCCADLVTRAQMGPSRGASRRTNTFRESYKVAAKFVSCDWRMWGRLRIQSIVKLENRTLLGKHPPKWRQNTRGHRAYANIWAVLTAFVGLLLVLAKHLIRKQKHLESAF